MILDRDESGVILVGWRELKRVSGPGSKHFLPKQMLELPGDKTVSHSCSGGVGVIVISCKYGRLDNFSGERNTSLNPSHYRAGAQTSGDLLKPENFRAWFWTHDISPGISNSSGPHQRQAPIPKYGQWVQSPCPLISISSWSAQFPVTERWASKLVQSHLKGTNQEKPCPRELWIVTTLKPSEKRGLETQVPRGPGALPDT